VSAQENQNAEVGQKRKICPVFSPRTSFSDIRSLMMSREKLCAVKVIENAAADGRLSTRAPALLDF